LRRDAGFICNALIRPVRAKWHIEKEDAINSSARGLALGSKGTYGIGRGGLDAQAFLAWALVGIPLARGVWQTLENAPALEGCNTWGKTYEEAIKHAEEALTLCFESFDELGKSILEERSLKQPIPSG
jgi:predicted RNase H-like HicB family nuclease